MKKNTETFRSTRAIINLSSIRHNMVGIRKRIGKQRELMAVVKGDGYGHGAVEVSRSALGSGATCLGIALPEEADPIRKSGIQAPILVLGLIRHEEVYKITRWNLEQTVCDIGLARALDQEARNSSVKINIHMKVDSGMGRIGVLPQDALHLAQELDKLTHLRLKGIFSHFSTADEQDTTYAEKQMAIFEHLSREIDASGIKICQKHMANSAGVLALPSSYYDLVRPGIMIYGLYPSREVPRSIPLIPAMTLQSKIAYMKRVPAGTPVSYGRTHYTHRNTVIATLPVGYADGYNRRLSNRAYASIHGKLAPLIGRVCMDMCMFDVTNIKDVHPGDDAILFGRSPTIDDLANTLDTINYEMVCSVGKRVPRIYKGVLH